MLLINQIKYIFLSFVLISCAGYHFRNERNPFENYGIKTITIPMFLNYSIIPNISGVMTKEITTKLTRYPGLRVYAGERGDTDAILLGIIASEEHSREVFETKERRFTDGALKESIGERNEFYIPIVTEISATLRLVLIKRPSKRELELLRDEKLGKYITGNNKIIFNETIPLTISFTREVAGNYTADTGGIMNFTKNKAALEKSIINISKSAAQTFDQVVLNAF